MRILIFNWRSFLNQNAGGAEKHCFEIFNRLAEQNHTIQLVASCDTAAPKNATVGKIKVFHPCRNEFLYPLFSMLSMPKFPISSFNIIIEDISKFPVFWPLLLSKILKKPFIAIIHHVHGKTLWKELPTPLNLIAALTELFSLKIYTLFKPQIVTVSQSTKKELTSIGFPEQNITVIPDGLNLKPSKPSTKEKTPFPLVIYFGRVKKYKQIDHLIQAAEKASEKIANLKLAIAGKGDKTTYSHLKDLTKKKQLEKTVKFHGELHENEKNKLFQKAWIYATASMKEGFGISVVEAQAYGLPVVAYAVPGINDTVKHMHSGILVKEGNIKELAKAITLLCKDKTLREKLSNGAIKNASQYNWDKSAEEFLKLIKKQTRKYNT